MTERRKGIISLILLAFVFASMGLFARYLSTNFKLLQQVYLRLFAGFLLGIVVFNRSLNFSKLAKINFKEWIILFIRAISYYLLGVTFFTQALILTKYSNVSFIGSLPLTAVFGFILLREKISLKKILFVILAFIGTILISVKDFSHIFIWGKGEVVALLSVIFFSFSYVIRRWHSKVLSNNEITQIMILLGAILVLLSSFFYGEGVPLQNWRPDTVLVILSAGLFNIINLFLINYGFQKIEAVLASNILTLEAAFAVVLGFLFYREVPAVKELLGGIIIIFSVIQMNKLEKVEKTK